MEISGKINEIWKDITSYEGLYQVSNLGRVKSIKHAIKIRKLVENKGYLYVVLYKNNIGKTFAAHRLVASEFILNTENKPEVNHIDGKRDNNLLNNLEWVTRSENTLHSFRFLGRKAQWTGVTGKRHHGSKSILQKSKSGDFIKEWDCQRDASRVLNISYKNISACCLQKPRFKSAGGFIWEFANKTV